MPDYGLEHLTAIRPSKTSIELFYDLDGDRDSDVREIRLYKNGIVSKPCVVLWDRNDDREITPDEIYFFDENCREAEGWFKSKLKDI